MNLGFGAILVGQSGTPLDPKLLPEQARDLGVLELIESLLFLSHCTRFDVSFVIARWCEWSRKEIMHILGFAAHSAEWSLIMKSAHDDWEDLRLSTSAMRRLARTKSS